MRFYSRTEVAELLELDEGFLLSLESEEIIVADAPTGESGEFSEQMLERTRVAHTLIHELDVNLAGAAIIIRMREEIAGLQRRLHDLHVRRSS